MTAARMPADYKKIDCEESFRLGLVSSESGTIRRRVITCYARFLLQAEFEEKQSPLVQRYLPYAANYIMQAKTTKGSYQRYAIVLDTVIERAKKNKEKFAPYVKESPDSLMNVLLERIAPDQVSNYKTGWYEGVTDDFKYEKFDVLFEKKHEFKQALFPVMVIDEKQKQVNHISFKFFPAKHTPDIKPIPVDHRYDEDGNLTGRITNSML